MTISELLMMLAMVGGGLCFVYYIWKMNQVEEYRAQVWDGHTFQICKARFKGQGKFFYDFRTLQGIDKDMWLIVAGTKPHTYLRDTDGKLYPCYHGVKGELTPRFITIPEMSEEAKLLWQQTLKHADENPEAFQTAAVQNMAKQMGIEIDETQFLKSITTVEGRINTKMLASVVDGSISRKMVDPADCTPEVLVSLMYGGMGGLFIAKMLGDQINNPAVIMPMMILGVTILFGFILFQRRRGRF